MKHVFKNGTMSGLIAGLIYWGLVIIMILLLLGDSPWRLPRMTGAIVMGREVLPPPATFDMGVILVGLIVHFILSMIYGVIIGAVVRNMSMGTAIVIGAIMGLALYFINFYGFTGVFPWFAKARNWVTILGHIVFGSVSAWVFMRLLKNETKTA